MRAPGTIAVLATQKNSHSSRTNSPMSHCRHRDAKPARGRFPLEEPVAMRRPTVLVPLDRTMHLPLTLAGGLRTTFADVVSSPLPGRVAALVRRLQADRNERSGEERNSAALFEDRSRAANRRA